MCEDADVHQAQTLERMRKPEVLSRGERGVSWTPDESTLTSLDTDTIRSN